MWLLPSWCCKSLARKRGPAGSSAQQETARAHVRRGPNKIRDALESKHRIVNKERNRIDAVRGVRRSCGNKRAHRTGFGDSFLKNLPVFRFLVIEQRVDVDRLVLLPDARINSHRSKQRLHAKRPRFVGNDRHNQLADFRILQHFAQHSDERHRRRNFPALAAVEELLEQFVVVGHQRLRAHAALRRVAAQRFPARAQVLNLDAVFRRAVERHLDAIVIVQRNAKPRAKLTQLFFIQFFLLVRDVLAFARFSQPVSFNRARQNDRRAALVLHRGLIRRVHLARIVPAQPQAPQRLIRQRLDQLQQPRIASKKMFADVRAGRNHQLLVFAVHQFAHALHEQAFRVALQNRIPLAAPQEP